MIDLGRLKCQQGRELFEKSIAASESPGMGPRLRELSNTPVATIRLDVLAKLSQLRLEETNCRVVSTVGAALDMRKDPAGRRVDTSLV